MSTESNLNTDVEALTDMALFLLIGHGFHRSRAVVRSLPGGNVPRLNHVLLLCTVALLIPSAGLASPITIDFESVVDGEAITTQFPGLTFSNAIALTATVSLNEAEFPPFSGSNVASDDGGPIEIDFSQPVADVGGYFSYVEPLVIQAFSASHTLLGSLSSAFLNNTALSGDLGSLPNEFLQFGFGGISSVTIAGDPLGGSFALDDFTYTSTESNPVPEPTTLSLLAGGFFALGWLLRRRNDRGQVTTERSGIETHA